jgi:hypothetical protein
MTNLSLDLRTKLEETSVIRSSRISKILKDPDGTIKLQIELHDKKAVETVLLIDKENRKTACVSCQVGCAMKCAFCQTGQLGLARNLTAAEIVEQFLFLEQEAGPLNNIVFMGMGEPLMNLSAIRKSVDVLTHKKGRNLSSRRITLSTSGVIKGIYDLADNGPLLRLAVSLTTADEDLSNVINDVLIPQLDASVETYADSDNTITDEIKFHSVNTMIGYTGDLTPSEMCNVIGTIDGEYYIIEVCRDKANQFVRLSKLSDTGKATTDVGPGYAQMTGEANPCEYSMEDAQQMALDYVNGLGIENMSVVYTADVLSSSYDAEEEIVYAGDGYDASQKLDGYNVYLARSYDDYKTVFTSEQFMNWYGAGYTDSATG